MLYIIGGVAKAGKSLISQKILKERKISIFSTDYLMVGLSDTIDGFRINVDTDRDIDVSKKIEPIIEKILMTMLSKNEDYTIEGVHIRPRLVAKLLKAYPDKIKAIYLLYDEVNTHDKADELNQFVKAKERTWLDNYHGEKLHNLIEILKQESLDLKQECVESNVKYLQVYNIAKQEEDIINHLFK